MGVARQFENLHAFVHVGLLRRFVPVDLALQALLLRPPLASKPVEEVAANLTVELVDVHGVNALAQASVLGLEPFDRLLVLPPLIRVARLQRLPHPGQHLVVEVQAAEQLGELNFQRLLAHIFAAAGGRVALALIGVAGAMVIDVLLLLDLADDRAAALTAGNQPREREVVRHAALLLGEAPIHDTLNTFPQFHRDQRLMPPSDHLAVPLVPAGIEPGAQDRMDGADRHLRTALAVAEAGIPSQARGLLQGVQAGRIPLEQLRDDRRHGGISGNNLLAVWASNVAIAEGRLGGPDALLGLLLHPLAGFLGQVVDVVLRHQHLDAVHELFRRPRFPRQDYPFFGEMDLNRKLIHRHPVL